MKIEPLCNMSGFSYLAVIINTYNLVLTYIHHIFHSRVDQSSRKYMFYARLAASCFWTGFHLHHCWNNFPGRTGKESTTERREMLHWGSDSLGFYSTYGLLTKCEVKMAGYWPRSFFASLWTSTPSRSINSLKKELGQYPAILTSHLVNNPYLLSLRRFSILAY